MQPIYIVSLLGSPRRELIAASLRAHRATFSFEDAIDARHMKSDELEAIRDDEAITGRYGRLMTAAEVGCFLSHRSVWMQIAESGCGAVVLEDDALLTSSFFKHVMTWDGASLSNVADILLLGRAKLSRSSARSIAIHEPLKSWMTLGELRIGFPFKQWTSGAVGYWISATAARQLVSGTGGRVQSLLDDWPFHRDRLGLRIAEVRPYVVWEGFETMPSSIESERRLVSLKRSPRYEVLLRPLRLVRTGIRWIRIGGRASVGRTKCPTHERRGTNE